MRWASALLMLSCLCLTQCGQGNFNTSPPMVTAPPVLGYTLYHAYGDSITYGYGLSDQSMTYASLAAAYNQVPLTTLARNGDEACDVLTHQIFLNFDSPALTSNGLYSLLIGTNDVDVRGTGPGELTFNLCDQAAISWLATPLEAKLPATNSSVTVTGASHLETQFAFDAVTTDALGATITFPFTRATASPLYLWYRINDGNPGTFTCALDSATPVAFVNAPTPAIQTQNQTTLSVALYRFASVAPGAHTLRCTQTSAGASAMGIIAIGGPPPAATAHRPRLLVGLLTPQLNGYHAAAIAAYDQDIQTSVALFAADGLDVELFNAAQNMSGTGHDFVDSVHPNALGHQEIFAAFQQTMQ